MNKKRGHFIVFEGTDGSGKATQVKLLRAELQRKGVKHQVIAFPRYGGNPYSKLISNYLNGDFGEVDEVNNYLISLAYAGDRFLAKEIINDWLDQGYLVIADRYVSSNKAFMGAKLPKDKRQEFIDWLDDLEYSINGIPREELTLFLNVPVDLTFKNVAQKGGRDYLKNQTHDIHERNLNYQEETRKVYLGISEIEPGWEVINCIIKDKMIDRQTIHSQIKQILSNKEIINI